MDGGDGDHDTADYSMRVDNLTITFNR